MNTRISITLLMAAFTVSAQDQGTRPRRTGLQEPVAVATPAPAPRPAAPPTPLPAANDGLLSEIRRRDKVDRDTTGQFVRLPAAEHMRRAAIYHSNRAFAEARGHWQAVLERYPDSESAPPALFGMGRSNFQEQQYKNAQPFFQQLADQFPDTFDGREGRYFIAATNLRLGKFNDAVKGYDDYIKRYPAGERIEPAHLNAIDTLREAGRNSDALVWIGRTRAQFPRTITETNAVFAKLRLELATRQWNDAARTAAELRGLAFGKDVMTDVGEVTFLRGYALERAGRKDEAVAAYLSVADRVGSYHGGQATARLQKLAPERPETQERVARITRETKAAAGNYPLRFSAQVLKAAKAHGLDPRFVLAIMKQESGFNPNAKSPSAARGLLQLTIDTARKFAPRASYANLTENDLYKPAVNTAVGCAYIAELLRLFPANYDAVAASYNGGEDNAARWVKRANNPDAGIFAAEVGFSETKTYVFKVLANYRAYQMLYTNELKAR
jgi:soluble lytic murein transglycosylase-like protein/TolA-binding protein